MLDRLISTIRLPVFKTVHGNVKAPSLQPSQIHLDFGLTARLLADWISKPIVAVSFICAFGAFLRFYHLGFKSLWLDEAMMYWIASGGFKEILEQNALNNSAPPLFPLLLRAVIAIDSSEVALRLIPCLAGIAALPGIYLLAKEFVPESFAYLATLIVAIAPTQIQYSQQVREYSLAFLLATCMLLIFCRFLKQQNIRYTLLLALVLILSVFTQYGLGLLILAINLVFFANFFGLRQRKRGLAPFLIAQALALVAVAAVYYLSLQHQLVAGGRAAYYLPGAYWEGTLGSLLRMAVLNTERIFHFAFPTQLLVLACVFGATDALVRRRHWPVVWLLIAPMGVAFVAALLRAYPYLGARQAIFLTPMIYVFAAMGIAFLYRLSKNRPLILITSILLIGYAVQDTAVYQSDRGPENIRPIVSELLASIDPADGLYVYSGAVPAFKYYFRGHSHEWIEGIARQQAPREFLRQLDGVLEQETRVWLVFSHVRGDSVKDVFEYVSSRRRLTLEKEDAGAWLYLAP